MYPAAAPIRSPRGSALCHGCGLLACRPARVLRFADPSLRHGRFVRLCEACFTQIFLLERPAVCAAIRRRRRARRGTGTWGRSSLTRCAMGCPSPQTCESWSTGWRRSGSGRRGFPAGSRRSSPPTSRTRSRTRFPGCWRPAPSGWRREARLPAALWRRARRLPIGGFGTTTLAFRRGIIASSRTATRERFWSRLDLPRHTQLVTDMSNEHDLRPAVEPGSWYRRSAPGKPPQQYPLGRGRL